MLDASEVPHLERTKIDVCEHRTCEVEGVDLSIRERDAIGGRCAKIEFVDHTVIEENVPQVCATQVEVANTAMAEAHRLPSRLVKLG